MSGVRRGRDSRPGPRPPALPAAPGRTQPAGPDPYAPSPEFILLQRNRALTESHQTQALGKENKEAQRGRFRRLQEEQGEGLPAEEGAGRGLGRRARRRWAGGAPSEGAEREGGTKSAGLWGARGRGPGGRGWGAEGGDGLGSALGSRGARGAPLPVDGRRAGRGAPYLQRRSLRRPSSHTRPVSAAAAAAHRPSRDPRKRWGRSLARPAPRVAGVRTYPECARATVAATTGEALNW